MTRMTIILYLFGSLFLLGLCFVAGFIVYLHYFAP